jgi:hypothetical protein
MEFTIFKLKTQQDTIAKELITTIVRTVYPETWQRLGGSGMIKLLKLVADKDEGFDKNCLLVVWNTEAVRGRVKAFLSEVKILV